MQLYERTKVLVSNKTLRIYWQASDDELLVKLAFQSLDLGLKPFAKILQEPVKLACLNILVIPMV